MRSNAPIAPLMNSHVNDTTRDHNVSLPRDMLENLLSSINDLKSKVGNLQEMISTLQESGSALQKSVSMLEDENKALRDELSSTKTDLMILRENSGVRFPQFMKLPVELRHTIWRFACKAPQIHNISDQGGSRSRVNVVMNACSEAKSVGLALQLDYFLVGAQICYGTSAIFGTIKNYINLDVDTIWLTRNGTFPVFPENIQWICGKCHLNERYRTAPCCATCLSAHGDHGTMPVRRMAVNFMTWEDPDDRGLEMGTWELCESHCVKELLLIVGDVKVVEWESDISFVAPAQQPCETEYYMSKVLKVPNNPGLEILNQYRHKSWQQLEEVMVRKAEEFKSQHAEVREAALDSGEVSEETIDSSVYWSHLRDISTWTPPKIRFVEALKGTHKWTLPPVDRKPVST